MSGTVEMLQHIKPRDPKNIRLPGFLSTSLRDDLETFKGNEHLIIYVFQECPNAYYFAKSSAFDDEAEVLFPPYSAFIITKTKMQDGVLNIWMDAQDNGRMGEEFDRLMLEEPSC